MVAEEKMANVFICMLQFGKLLKLYFFLFQSGPRLELTVQSLPKLLKGEAGSRGKGLSPSVILSTIPTFPCTGSYFTQECLILVFWQGRWERNDLVVLKPASLMCVFWQNCLTPFLIGLLPSCW